MNIFMNKIVFKILKQKLSVNIECFCKIKYKILHINKHF